MKRFMKILEINVCCGVGSTGRICTDIADLAEKNGHICKVAYGRDGVLKEHEKYAVRIGNKLTVLLDAFLSRIFDNAGFNSKCSTRKFIKWVKQFDPDIIHLHNLHGYYINVEVLFDYLKKANKPVIWTLHDCWSFTGHCAHFDAVGCNKWLEGECSSCNHKQEYPSSALFSRAKKNYIRKKNCFCGVEYLRIVTPSEWLADLVKKSFLKEYPVSVISNGIDTSVFTPKETCFKKDNGIEDKIMVLSVASVWTDKKGFSDFIELSKNLDDRYVCVMVGVDKKQKEKIPTNMIAIERTNSIQELAEIYSAADVFVNLTYEDTYPTVNLEALSCGTPIVTYPTGGSKEIVIQNGGFVSNNKDYVEISKIITENFINTKNNVLIALNNSKVFDRMGKYDEYLDVYEKLV